MQQSLDVIINFTRINMTQFRDTTNSVNNDDDDMVPDNPRNYRINTPCLFIFLILGYQNSTTSIDAADDDIVQNADYLETNTPEIWWTNR